MFLSSIAYKPLWFIGFYGILTTKTAPFGEKKGTAVSVHKLGDMHDRLAYLCIYIAFRAYNI